MNEFRIFLRELKKNPLTTMMGVSIAAIIYLCLYIKQDKERDNAVERGFRTELVECETRHAKEMRAVLEAANADLRSAAERQSKIEAEIRRLAKRR